MQFKVDDETVFELTASDMALLKSHIHEDMLNNDLKRRARYIIEHLCEQVWKEFYNHWGQKLMSEGISIPASKADFIALVQARPDYESAKVRIEKAQAANQAKLEAQ